MSKEPRFYNFNLGGKFMNIIQVVDFVDTVRDLKGEDLNNHFIAFKVLNGQLMLMSLEFHSEDEPWQWMAYGDKYEDEAKTCNEIHFEDSVHLAVERGWTVVGLKTDSDGPAMSIFGILEALMNQVARDLMRRP